MTRLSETLTGGRNFITRRQTLFHADYATSINATSGLGDLDTIATQGSPSVSGGYLLLAPNPHAWVSYDSALNADMGLEGCVRVKIRPNYNGAPSQSQRFFALAGGVTGQADDMRIEHISGSGRLDIIMFNDTSASQVVTVQGVWTPVDDTTYEFELNFNWNSGVDETRIFIAGTQFQSTVTTSPPGEIRGNDNTRIDLGRGGAGNNNEFDVGELTIFNSVQHTADYTP